MTYTKQFYGTCLGNASSVIPKLILFWPLPTEQSTLSWIEHYNYCLPQGVYLDATYNPDESNMELHLNLTNEDSFESLPNLEGYKLTLEVIGFPYKTPRKYHFVYR